MHETEEELKKVQLLLDESAAGAGRHLREIITDDRRLKTRELCEQMQGMCLIVVGTVTSDGRPLVHLQPGADLSSP